MQLSYITAASDIKTHSERPACIKDPGRYYIVFALSDQIVIINVYIITEVGYYKNCSAVKRDFLKPLSICPW